MFWRSRQVLVGVVAALLLSCGTALAADQLPESHLYLPWSDWQVEVGESVLIAGGGWDGDQADTLREYQVSMDGGETWNDGYRTATVPVPGGTFITQALWEYVFTPQEPGVYTIISRVNTETVFGQASSPVRLYVGVPGPARGACDRCRFFTMNPKVFESEGLQVELGLRFQVDRSGVVTSISTSGVFNNDEEVSRVRLWRGDGTLLAEQSGPRKFTTPVPVIPGEEYVASYTSWRGKYEISENTFPATVLYRPFVLPTHAGVYSYDDGFPTQTWHDSHYGVSPEFVAS